ncbi:1-acyl-sn-glycerol-3-phosphate acyltransferase alpha-like [Uranotaenia lowii]|uniref:1-acyl-sn-glycerol-3-phosphate acyltransferase alpha-like n=1 Tax=Uranotaenia lowii TaxID=190385 RepID=UPI0024783E7C|nr:1-acyl-sn-glycerol-3-phosphate acyltransferase alpha-like [Uranotaenia lowii]
MTSCTLCQILGLIVRYYLYAWVASLSIWLGLLLLSKVGKDGSKFKYYAKYGMIYFATQAFTTLFAPISLFRPMNPENVRIIGAVIARLSSLLPITWELRNADILKNNKGAVVMCNHQSSMDILGMFIIYNSMGNVIPIAKREMLLLVPFGPAALLAGVTFINRKNRASAVETMNGCKRKMVNEGFKMYLFPEGTRYPERGMLPFKKGGFHTAIETGLPIIPIVYSHMYFIDGKKYLFKPGHVVAKVLDPIPTKGLTKDNLDDLMARTRDIMLVEYDKLCAEMDANLANPRWVAQTRPRFATFDSRKSR